MTTLADKSLLSGGDNKPPMLEKHLYDSWKSIMELYMMNRPHGRMILASIEKGPFVWLSITVDGVTRLKEYIELTPAEAIQADCDIKAINIILQGLPIEIYAHVSQHRVAMDLWEKIKLLMQETSLTKQERECKLYDEFDKFTYKKGESLHEYYLRFTLLLNDMNIYKMPLEQFQVNTKFWRNLRVNSFTMKMEIVLEPISNKLMGRQTSFAAGTSRTYTPGASESNSAKQRTVQRSAISEAKREDIRKHGIEVLTHMPDSLSSNKNLAGDHEVNLQQGLRVTSSLKQNCYANVTHRFLLLKNKILVAFDTIGDSSTMNIGKDTTELSSVQQRLHGVSTTCQSYSPFNNSEHTCDSTNVTSHHSFAYIAALASDIDSRTSCPTTRTGPMPVEVTTVAKQAFVELLEEGINIPAWLAFNSEDGVNVVSDDSLETQKL
ncbi:hypothetical protein Tco_0757036 [Tanacetum coccineum]